MKIAIVFALAILALLNLQTADGSPYHIVRSRRDTDFQICKLGDWKKEGCNDCFCIADGSGWACTDMACSENHVVALPTENETPRDDTVPSERTKRNVHGRPGEPGFRCDPNSHFKYECNSCICMNDGRTAACTLMACDIAL